MKANGQNAGQIVGTFYNPPRYSAMELTCDTVCTLQAIFYSASA